MYNEPKKGSERISEKDGGRIYREFIENLLRFNKLSDKSSSRKLVTRLFQQKQDNKSDSELDLSICIKNIKRYLFGEGYKRSILS